MVNKDRRCCWFPTAPGSMRRVDPFPPMTTLLGQSGQSWRHGPDRCAWAGSLGSPQAALQEKAGTGQQLGLLRHGLPRATLTCLWPSQVPSGQSQSPTETLRPSVRQGGALAGGTTMVSAAGLRHRRLSSSPPSVPWTSW